MTDKIHILPENLMKRIAAGEVIERPSSVVKELIENALDANSDQLTLLIKDAGMELIQVMDNGDGMSEADAMICCERHSTSKISEIQDLDNIRTYGFRGEALASISSVSRMEIRTRREEEEEGSLILLEEGRLVEVQKIAMQKGTSVAVKDLFHNIPVRRKFLKSPNTELKQIMATFRRQSLVHHDRDFLLMIDGEQTLDLRKSTRMERIKELINRKWSENLIPVQMQLPLLAITGYISRPGQGRHSREDQFIYLNGRYILNKSLIHAIVSAYGSRLEREEFPVFALFIEMDPRYFDVNVHPTKIEVRFTDERFVYRVIKQMIEDSLKKPHVIPDFQLVVPSSRKQSRMKISTDMGQLTLEVQQPGSAAVPDTSSNKMNVPSLWQIHNRYILSQIKSGLTIIDQHIAHERVLYERALKAREAVGTFSQQLLFPQTITLQPEQYLVLCDILPSLQKIGFEIREFGKNTVIIEAVPVDMRSGQEADILLGIIDTYREESDKNDLFETVARVFACKSAIKAGDPLTFVEMSSLIDQLFSTEEPYFCPHGRPIIINLSLEEIDRRFGR